jgi:hypothetical protein
MAEWQTENFYGKQVLVEGPQTDDLRAAILAHCDSRGETVSRLAKVAHGIHANGTEVHEFLDGRRRMTP